MGLTIYANGVDRSFDLGYGGFANLRGRIAEAYDKDLSKVYSDSCMCMTYPDKWIGLINSIIRVKKFPDEDQDIFDFLFASDCGGQISHRTCKKIYELIKGIDLGGEIFTYAGRSDGRDYEYFEEFLKTCYSKRAHMRWD